MQFRNIIVYYFIKYYRMVGASTVFTSIEQTVYLPIVFIILVERKFILNKKDYNKAGSQANR